MIDAFRDRFGVVPICRVLMVPTSSYYAAESRAAVDSSALVMAS
jgi:hypothetical protein